jgi:sugar phosphate isomerase/epimerase
MSADPLPDLSRLCIHTVTTKPWSLREACEQYAKAGVKHITVWRDAIGDMAPAEAGQMIRDHGLEVTSLCRGGFFAADNALDREQAIYDNRRMIDEAAELGAPLIVLVCGAVPKQPLEVSRRHIFDGIAQILRYAESSEVKLGIEPLHPMYADSRSAINTMAQANDMAEQLASPNIGVVVDVYHLWWDPHLESEIDRCGRHGNLFAYHVCDWKTPTEHLLTDRGLMGEGTIPLREIRQWVEATGFDGPIEVEIFSERYWSMDQAEYLKLITDAYLEHA